MKMLFPCRLNQISKEILNMEPVHITGMGLITSIGNNRDAVTQSLREMKHGIDFHP